MTMKIVDGLLIIGSELLSQLLADFLGMINNVHEYYCLLEIIGRAGIDRKACE